MMDIHRILTKLPHRYPILLVDRVLDIDLESKTLRALKNVTVNEPFFTGHFPGRPVMPAAESFQMRTLRCQPLKVSRVMKEIL